MRLALGVSYNGFGSQGWQSQPSGLTIQDQLERALGLFATEPISTVCAGRTDAGVHGLMQVVHFDTGIQRSGVSWVRGTNTFLPPTIAVQWARAVPDAFHARASAVARRYAYVLLESPVRPAIEAGRAGARGVPHIQAGTIGALQLEGLRSHSGTSNSFNQAKSLDGTTNATTTIQILDVAASAGLGGRYGAQPRRFFKRWNGGHTPTVGVRLPEFRF